VPPRIAIPIPHSTDREYGERAIPQYERAVALAGGEPVRIPLDQSAEDAKKMIERCAAVLLPGSKADVDPARFYAKRSEHTAAADPRRDTVDSLLLDDAYQLRKPILGICYGLQSLNVHLHGSLIQHIPDFLPPETRGKINHEAGRKVAVAHTVEIAFDSSLAGILKDSYASSIRTGRAQLGGAVSHSGTNREEHGFTSEPALSKRSASKGADQGRQKDRALAPEGNALVISVNSSHHQSAAAIGHGLRVVARCRDDGIIEALEGTSPDHFVIAVQWHPERSVDEDELSRAIFRALIQAATVRGH
jgi:putative glutamine amidotransferase